MRDKTIDILRGIGIISVVAGHARGSLGIDIFPVYSFHMPLFFFISGLFFKEEHIESIPSILHKICLKILAPAVLFLLIYDVLISCVLNKIGYSHLWGEISIAPIKTLFLYGGQFSAAYWFISCYSCVYMYFAIFHCRIFKYLHSNILQNLKSSQIQLLFLGLYFLLAYLALRGSLALYDGKTGHEMWVVAYFNHFTIITIRCLFAFFFYYIGFLFSRFKIMNYIDGKISFALLFITYISQGLLFKNSSISFSMQIMHFNNSYSPILTSLLAILFFFTISKIITNIDISKYIAFLGKNTYAILLHHIFGFMVLNIIFVAFGLVEKENVTSQYYEISPGYTNYLYIITGIVFSLFIASFHKKISRYFSQKIKYFTHEKFWELHSSVD